VYQHNAQRSKLNSERSTLYTKYHHEEVLHNSGSLPRHVSAICAGKETTLCGAKKNRKGKISGQWCQIK
jgi:hypothetical protein